MRIALKSLLLVLLFTPVIALAQKNYLKDPMVRIAMSAYAAQIAENPQNYGAYYSRAKDYFRYGESELALTDLNKAIELFPANEGAELSQAYTMRALIYQKKGDGVKALADFNEALTLDPQSYYSLLGRADLLCEMGDYAHAQDDYQMLLRRDARCQEAYLGLARAAYKQQNMGDCNEMLAKAQNANPSNADFYMQRGALYEEMKEYGKAADDYVSAIFYGENSKSVFALNRLSRIDYDAVVNSLTTIIESSEDKGFYYFIRATIHKNNYHYSASIKDWNEIVEKKYFYHNSIFANRAYCYMRLGQFEYAIEDMNKAIVMKGDDMSYYITRGRLYRIQGIFDKAAEDLAIAATFDPSNVELLQERGLLAVEQKDYESAGNYYNEAIMYDAENAKSYLLRAENCLRLKDNEGAVRNFEMVANYPEEQPQMSSLRGFALASLGRNAEAEEWAETVMRVDSEYVDASLYYQAACLYALTGNKKQAYNYLEKAFKAGYGDYYDVYFESDTPVSLAPLRNETDFADLVKSYVEIF